ncbi:hypothetical protein J5J10_11715 [Ciceribacter sp. L1K23]|uniref:hypothetical protein n=1 Tax=Ciceribacter sp. L1K23 TaxID=2820276 RepID=UPI001B842630|nr:hypothetical protein [Ciceribacter sp. L1K23]MBR0556345.1 hypothetical protein [Ciceribacter sp. L1K23]
MQDDKEWYRSKTVWGGLIAVAAPLLDLAGFPIDQAMQADLSDKLALLAASVGGLLAIWGRLTATSTIR